MRARARTTGDRGSMAVELAFVAPIFLLLLALVYGYGRVAQISGTLDAATRNATRLASQARTVEDADEAVRRTILASLDRDASRCRETLRAGVVGLFRAGVPVRVKAECTYDLDDIGLPGVPGDITVSSTFTSPIDPNRGVTNGLRPAELGE